MLLLHQVCPHIWSFSNTPFLLFWHFKTNNVLWQRCLYIVCKYNCGDWILRVQIYRFLLAGNLVYHAWIYVSFYLISGRSFKQWCRNNSSLYYKNAMRSFSCNTFYLLCWLTLKIARFFAWNCALHSKINYKNITLQNFECIALCLLFLCEYELFTFRRDTDQEVRGAYNERLVPQDTQPW